MKINPAGAAKGAPLFTCDDAPSETAAAAEDEEGGLLSDAQVRELIAAGALDALPTFRRRPGARRGEVL